LTMAPEPVRMELLRESKELDVEFENGETYTLPHEFLRVYSPSAEVRGHAPSEYTLQVGKRHVAIDRIEPQGNYAVQIHFDDGHSTGIYTWEWLYRLCTEQESMWQAYLQQLADEGKSRDP